MTFDSLLASYLRSTPKPPSVQKAVAQWWPSFVAFCQAQELANPTALETRHLQRFQQSLTWEPQRGSTPLMRCFIIMNLIHVATL